MATTVEPSASAPQQTTTAAAPKAGRDWRRLVVFGVGAVVLVAVIAYFFIASAKRKEQFAARGLNVARAAAEAGNLPLASSELQKLAQSYKGTDAAAEAVLLLNQIRLANNQSELAVTNLREFLAGNATSKFAAPAAGLLGAALENTKRWGDAGDAYTDAAKRATADYLKVLYLTNAGRAYTTGGMTQKAVQAYRAAVQHPDAPNVVEAQVRLAELTDGKEGEASAPGTGRQPARN